MTALRFICAAICGLALVATTSTVNAQEKEKVEKKITFLFRSDDKLPDTLEGALRVSNRKLSFAEAKAIAESKIEDIDLVEVTFEEKAAEMLVSAKHLQVLTLHRTPGLHSALLGLPKGSKVTKLSISDSNGFGYKWDFLNDLPLEELFLAGVTLRNDELKHLKLTKLKRLTMIGSDMTDRGMAGLITMCPGVEELSLGRCRINGRGLRYCVGLAKLRVLSVWSCPLEEEHLAALSLCDGVQELYLHQHEAPKADAIGETGLAHIQKMKGLKRLDLLLTDDNKEAIEAFIKAKPKIAVKGHTV